MRTAVIISTGGAVAQYVATRRRQFKESLAVFISDRNCRGLRVAEGLDVPSRVVEETAGKSVSDAMLDVLVEMRVDYAYVFYTRMLRGSLLSAYENRLVNFHPSLLPACPGLHGFEDSMRSGARVIGSTVHFIDSGCDTGPQIMQTMVPVAPGEAPSIIRHKIFLQQCRALAQTHEWLAKGKVSVVNGAVRVAGAQYDMGEFVPNLDAWSTTLDSGEENL